jgi:transcriptional regulator with XRE-family HTH domain
MPDGPYSQAVELGKRLRRYREAAGLGIADAARALSCSDSRISRVENARVDVELKPLELRELARLYQIDDTKLAEMAGLLEASQQQGWWEPYTDVMPPHLDRYVALEGDAVAEQAWEPTIIHGLVQTEAYARAMFASDPRRPAEQSERLIDMRLTRQRALHRDQPRPLELWLIMDEIVVRRPVGGADVMRDQVQHLVRMASMPNVMIQIMPIARGAHLGMAGAFSILELEDQPVVVYIDSPAGNVVLPKPGQTRRFVNDFNMLRIAALTPDESLELLRTIAEES